jgi:quinate dehydrogenase
MSPSAQPEDNLAASFKYGTSNLTENTRSRPLRTFLFGYPIAKSLAPQLHASLFKSVGLPWTYELLETQDTSEFLPRLKEDDVVGCAITMPYKLAMLSAVDEVTEEGRMIGAINTVFLRKDPKTSSTRYIGTNTDCVGVREAFLQNHPNILERSRGKPALLIGGGGASRAAIYSLWKWLGASKVYIVNRLDSEVESTMQAFAKAGFPGELVHVKSVEQAEALEAPVLVVSAVPDFPPKEPGEILAREIVDKFLEKPEKGVALEMCYTPKPQTALYKAFKNAGWDVVFGTEALIWQGVAQESLWAELPLGRFGMADANKVIAEAIKNK